MISEVSKFFEFFFKLTFEKVFYTNQWNFIGHNIGNFVYACRTKICAVWSNFWFFFVLVLTFEKNLRCLHQTISTHRRVLTVFRRGLIIDWSLSDRQCCQEGEINAEGNDSWFRNGYGTVAGAGGGGLWKQNEYANSRYIIQYLQIVITTIIFGKWAFSDGTRILYTHR